MLIRIWWWVEPLWLTGYLMLFFFIPLAVLFDKVMPNKRISEVLAVLAFLPLVVSAASVIVWLIINALVWIWR